MVKLRGHHLLCILTYRGEGYSDAFTQNFSVLMERINKGEEIELVSGIDDVCDALQANTASTCTHALVCREAGVKKRDLLAMRDVAIALHLPPLKTGDKLTLTADRVKDLRHLFLTMALRTACANCTWHKLCTDIATHKFKAVRFLPHAQPT